MTVDIESMRPQFEAYILTERGKSYLERNDFRITPGRDYKNAFVQEAWEAWRACAAAMGPPIPNPSHVHCEECESIGCAGIRVREALPLSGPSPEAIRQARADGRAEALELLKGQDAALFESVYIGSHAIADTGDYDSHWNEEPLRALFKLDEPLFSVIDSLEATYWTQQAFIDNLQVQLSNEWLPIGAAEKDGRWILGWFEYSLYDREPQPWVAAVRWSGSDLQLWSMPGIGGLQPTCFRSIVGPDGQPIGIRTP